ncbi:MAG TPA: nuclear transport factor 2 family protein [Candidatus Cybelea sp.]|nr:nuclear transport factor 2 family protein [Candidatus Cybelea sp.]
MLPKIAVALLCAALAVPLAASADPVPDAAQKALNADYTLVCTASQDPTDANLTAAYALLAPDFVHVNFKGTQMQRDEFIAQGKQQIKQLHITSCANTITSMTLSDPSTIVAVVSGKIAGQIQAPDGSHDIDVSESSSDTWKLVSGTWLQTQSKDVSVLVKIDGKVVQDEGN